MCLFICFSPHLLIFLILMGTVRRLNLDVMCYEGKVLNLQVLGSMCTVSSVNVYVDIGKTYKI